MLMYHKSHHISIQGDDSLFVRCEFIPSVTNLHSIETGLSLSEITTKQQENHVNVVAYAPKQSSFVVFQFLGSFVSGFIPALWIVTLLAFLAWSPLPFTQHSNMLSLIVACVVLVIIFVSAMLSFILKLQANEVLRGFKSWIPTTCSVTRQCVTSDIKVTCCLCYLCYTH